MTAPALCTVTPGSHRGVSLQRTFPYARRSAVVSRLTCPLATPREFRGLCFLPDHQWQICFKNIPHQPDIAIDSLCS